MTVLKDRRPRAFTIVELLIVIAIVSFIAALLLPALTGAKAKGKAADCISRMRQIGIGFRLWANDNDGQFPWQVPVSKGGSGGIMALDADPAAFGVPFDWTDNFRAASNELVTPKILACPSDDRKTAHDKWATLDGWRHISYFLGYEAHESKPQSILAGDSSVSGALGGHDLVWNTFVGSSIDANWHNNPRHGRQGHIVLTDGSVHQTSTEQLREYISTALSGGSTQVVFSLPRGVF